MVILIGTLLTSIKVNDGWISTLEGLVGRLQLTSSTRPIVPSLLGIVNLAEPAPGVVVCLLANEKLTSRLVGAFSC